MTLSVIPVSPAEHTLPRHLYPLYLHDLSEFGDGYSLDAEGLWQPDYLPYWLSGKEGCHPMLFRLDGRPVGFAMVGQAPFPFMTPGRDFRLSEFFVLRGARRHGVGRRAAFALFDRFPGTWELSQLPANQGATAFWRRVIGEYMDGAFEDTTRTGAQRRCSTAGSGDAWRPNLPFSMRQKPAQNERSAPLSTFACILYGASMGDYFQTIVDKDVPEDEAPRLAERVREWLVARRIIAPERSDCAVGEPGHQPGPAHTTALQDPSSDAWDVEPSCAESSEPRGVSELNSGNTKQVAPFQETTGRRRPALFSSS